MSTFYLTYSEGNSKSGRDGWKSGRRKDGRMEEGKDDQDYQDYRIIPG